MKTRTLIIFLILSVNNFAFSQRQDKGSPLCFKSPTLFEQSKSSINIVELPYLDNEIEDRKSSEYKSKSCKNCENLHYGKGIDQTVDIIGRGYKRTLDDGGSVWLMKFKSPTAYGMQFYFNKFHLPKGAKLYIFNKEKSVFLGNYTSEDNPEDNNFEMKFGTQYIEGNEIYIEYYEPPSPEFHGEVQVGRVIHIFKNIFEEFGGGPFTRGFGSEYCNINVVCDNIWTREIRSVAIILIYTEYHDYFNSLVTGWMGFCSGALINNSKQDGKPYFLTATHCAGPRNQKPAPNDWVFVFNHQTKNCIDDGSDIPNNIYSMDCVYGATIKSIDATRTSADGLLLELKTTKEILTSYKACYAGWTLDADTVGQFVGIHHPRGDVKKISYSSTVVTDNDYKKDWAVKWDWGTTQKGSSGSPLFDRNHRIIGQLRDGALPFEGAPDCHPDKISGYGKFSVSWIEGDFEGFLNTNYIELRCIDTYCPTPANPSGGGGGLVVIGGGEITNCCHESCISMDGGGGMVINGSKEQNEVPCIDTDTIKLGTLCDCYSDWRGCWGVLPKQKDFIGRTAISNMPSGLPRDLCECHNPYYHGFIRTCECTYLEHFISIYEVDKNLNIIGPEYNCYIYRKMTWWIGIIARAAVREIVIPISELETNMGIRFVAGKYYKIRIILNNHIWKENVRYFRYIRQNLVVENNITNDLYANNITIKNTTVTNAHTVAARDYITIKNATIKAGTYKIDKQSCQNIYMPHKTGPIDDFEHEHEGQEFGSNSGAPCGCSTNETNKIVSDKDGIIIYPNPANTYISIVSERTISKIEIVDNLGKVLYTKDLSDNSTNIDISFLNSGSYIIKIQVPDKTLFKRFSKIE